MTRDASLPQEIRDLVTGRSQIAFIEKQRNEWIKFGCSLEFLIATQAPELQDQVAAYKAECFPADPKREEGKDGGT